jgi:CxxC motif-containing protein
VVFNPDVRKIFVDSYPNITFLPIENTGNYYFASYKIGYFFNWKEGYAPEDPRTISLSMLASKILGLGLKEYKPKLKINKSEKSQKKYVCIGIQSTAQCKYWNRKNGWEDIVKYLNQNDYEVWCIDKHSSFGSGEYMNYMPQGVIDKTGNIPLETRLEQLAGAEFFIGIGSGLSWLAWAANIPVIMISGFSKSWAEFYTPYRVINENVCNGCWNDTSHHFDKSKWDWCPRGKNFECSKEISPSQVISCINRLIRNDSITIITSHANTDKKKKILIECIKSVRDNVRTKIILSSNTTVPEDIQQMCDYVVCDKENPKLDSSEYEKYGLTYFYWHNDGVNVTYRPVPFDYGYSVYRMLKNAVGLAKGLGYKKVHVLDYDYEPNNVIFSEHSLLLETHDAVFYRFDEGKFDALNAYLGAFFSAKTDPLSKLLNVYESKHEYYSEPSVRPLNVFETQLYHLANNKMKIDTMELRESELKSQIVTNKQVQAYEKERKATSYWKFDETNNKLSFGFEETIKSPLLVLRERTTNLQCYRWETDQFERGVEYYIIPTFSAKLIDTDFSGFIFDVYQNNKLAFSEEIVIKRN